MRKIPEAGVRTRVKVSGTRASGLDFQGLLPSSSVENLMVHRALGLEHGKVLSEQGDIIIPRQALL